MTVTSGMARCTSAAAASLSAIASPDLLRIGGGIIERGHDLARRQLEVGSCLRHGVGAMAGNHGDPPDSQPRPFQICLSPGGRVAELDEGEILLAQALLVDTREQVGGKRDRRACQRVRHRCEPPCDIRCDATYSIAPSRQWRRARAPRPAPAGRGARRRAPGSGRTGTGCPAGRGNPPGGTGQRRPGWSGGPAPRTSRR